MFIGDVTLNDFKKLIKTEQVFVFEDKKVIELYAFKTGQFVLRTIVKKPKDRMAMLDFKMRLPENRVNLIARSLGKEFERSSDKKLDRIIRLMEGKD